MHALEPLHENIVLIRVPKSVWNENLAQIPEELSLLHAYQYLPFS